MRLDNWKNTIRCLSSLKSLFNTNLQRFAFTAAVLKTTKFICTVKALIHSVPNSWIHFEIFDSIRGIALNLSFFQPYNSLYILKLIARHCISMPSKCHNITILGILRK